MYQYKRKEGAENKTFGGDNVRNLESGIVESDHPLNSPDLELINNTEATVPDTKPEATPAPNAPQPPAPAPAPNPAPQQVDPQQPKTQGAN